MALAEGLNETDANALIADREKKPFESVQDFLIHDALAGLEIKANYLSISSTYFLFKAEVQIDQVRTELNSVLHRLSDKVTVVTRSR